MAGRYPLYVTVEANRQHVRKRILHWLAKMDEGYLFYGSDGHAYRIERNEASRIVSDMLAAVDDSFDRAPWSRSDPRVMALLVLGGLLSITIHLQSIWLLIANCLALAGMVVWFQWLVDGRPQHSLQRIRRQTTQYLSAERDREVAGDIARSHRFRPYGRDLTWVLVAIMVCLAVWVISGDDLSARLPVLKYYLVFFAVAATACLYLSDKQHERRAAQLGEMLDNREGQTRHYRLDRASVSDALPRG